MRNHAVKMAVAILLLSAAVPCLFAQSYETFTESTAFNNQKINRQKTILIVSFFNSFSWNRAVEKSIKAELDNRGIKSIILTDYYDVTSSLVEEEFSKAIENTDFGYLMSVNPGDIYTFSIGGGISKMEMIIKVDDYLSTVCMMELITEADTNDMLSESATKGPAINSMAKAAAEEYVKYLR